MASSSGPQLGRTTSKAQQARPVRTRPGPVPPPWGLRHRPMSRPGPSAHDSEAWSVQHGHHARVLPARSRDRCSNPIPVIRLPARPNRATRKRPAFPYPPLKRAKGALRWLQTGIAQAVLSRTHLHLHPPDAFRRRAARMVTVAMTRPGQHCSPARSPSHTIAGPDAQIWILLSACSHAWTVLCGSDRCLSALPPPYPLLKRA